MFFSIGKDEQSVKGFLIAFAVGKYSHAMLSVGRTAEIKILNDQVFCCPSAASIHYFDVGDLLGQLQRRRVSIVSITRGWDIFVLSVRS